MNSSSTDRILQKIIESLDIPESTYEKAAARYKDLGEWFDRADATCAPFNPHIYSQGSFRLGTVNRPLIETDEYDLDLGCRLRDGISKSTHTQKELKQLVGADLESYRRARSIHNPLAEKHRCWRLKYKDEMSFHLDAVPSIPQDAASRQVLQESMVAEGQERGLASNIAGHAGAITDNRQPDYEVISNAWRISNSEGFALWFQTRMKLAKTLMEGRARVLAKADVDELPAYQWKSPLQRCVQILKRHRDVMFRDEPDGKPISVILTTLAARAYKGEISILGALERIVTDMGTLVRPTAPRLPNPVNPAEDFADKWDDPKYRHLNLEDNFRNWLLQAQSDLRTLTQIRDTQSLVEQMEAKFGVVLGAEAAHECLGIENVASTPSTKTHSIVEPARPWVR